MLGPLEAWHDGVPVQLGDQQQRFVLVVLLLNANKPVSTARLTEIVWAGRETKPTLVRSYIKRLRDVVQDSGDVSIETTPTGYLLRVGEDQLDTVRFGRLRAEAADARADDPRRAITLLRAAARPVAREVPRRHRHRPRRRRRGGLAGRGLPRHRR